MSSKPLASRLEGKKIGDWEILKKRDKQAEDNSGFFSTCYDVKNNRGDFAFLKAYNYYYALQGRGMSADLLKRMTENFTYERDLLRFCNEHRMRRVVTAIDSGEYTEPNEILPVPYLVFEIANGNLKSERVLSNPDFSWRLFAFHGALVGLQQLHSKRIVHQDIKPSNILVFGDNISKIADLGNATQFNNESRWWNSEGPCGDLHYAPIELLYNYCSPDWNTRRLGADLFMMGGLLTYLVADINFLHLLHGRIPSQYKYRVFGGTFEEAKPVLEKAFYECLDYLHNNLDVPLQENLISIIAELCHPIPEERGNPQNRFKKMPRYSLERYISIVDRLAKKTQWIKNDQK